MDQLLAATIGTVIGSVVTGLIMVRLQRQKIVQEKDLYLLTRAYNIEERLSQYLGLLLSPHTPEMLKKNPAIEEMQQNFGALSRELHFMGFGGGTHDPLAELVEQYILDLKDHLRGKINREQLEAKREQAKSQARPIIRQNLDRYHLRRSAWER